MPVRPYTFAVPSPSAPLKLSCAVLVMFVLLLRVDSRLFGCSLNYILPFTIQIVPRQLLYYWQCLLGCSKPIQHLCALNFKSEYSTSFSVSFMCYVLVFACFKL